MRGIITLRLTGLGAPPLGVAARAQLSLGSMSRLSSPARDGSRVTSFPFALLFFLFLSTFRGAPLREMVRVPQRSYRGIIFIFHKYNKSQLRLKKKREIYCY